MAATCGHNSTRRPSPEREREKKRANMWRERQKKSEILGGPREEVRPGEGVPCPNSSANALTYLRTVASDPFAVAPMPYHCFIGSLEGLPETVLDRTQVKGLDWICSCAVCCFRCQETVLVSWRAGMQVQLSWTNRYTVMTGLAVEQEDWSRQGRRPHSHRDKNDLFVCNTPWQPEPIMRRHVSQYQVLDS